MMAETAELDTIYYDKEWKGVRGPHFASYYRIVETNPDINSKRLFRDYYITGELRGEGEYISLDRFDDTKSVMNGNWINYYKSGQVEQKGRRVNGKQEGEYIRFFENGNIAIKANYLNDILHGSYKVYDEKGLCLQQEFTEGKPKYDYCVITNNEGFYSKIRTSDKSPIYSSPSLYDQKVEYINGNAWTYYINDGLRLSMLNTRTNDYGKYFRVYVNITNNSFYPIEFDPNDVVAVLKDKNGNEKQLEVQTAQQYDKRIRRTQMWEEALVALGNGWAAANAGRSQSTTYTTFNGPNYSYGTRISTTIKRDASAAYQAQLVASNIIASFSQSNLRTRQSRQQGYLKRTTINPGESVSGYFNIKRKEGETLHITFNIAGAKFVFPWDVRRY